MSEKLKTKKKNDFVVMIINNHKPEKRLVG